MPHPGQLEWPLNSSLPSTSFPQRGALPAMSILSNALEDLVCSAPSSWTKFAPVWTDEALMLLDLRPPTDKLWGLLLLPIEILRKLGHVLCGCLGYLFFFHVFEFPIRDGKNLNVDVDPAPPGFRMGVLCLALFPLIDLGLIGHDVFLSSCMNLLSTLWIGVLLMLSKQDSHTLSAGFMAVVIMAIPLVLGGQEPTCATGAAVASVFRGLALASDATLMQPILSGIPAPATLSLSVGTAVSVAVWLAGTALCASALLLLGVLIVPVLGVVAALVDLARVADVVLPPPLPALTTYTLAVAAAGAAVHGVVTIAATTTSLLGVARRAPSVIPRLLTAQARASLFFLVPHWVGHWAGAPVWAGSLVGLALWAGRCSVACTSASPILERSNVVGLVGVWWLVSLGLRGDLPPFALVRILVLVAWAAESLVAWAAVSDSDDADTYIRSHSVGLSIPPLALVRIQVLAAYAACERFRYWHMVAAVRAYVRERALLATATTGLLLWAGILPLWCLVRILYLYLVEASIIVPARVGVLVAAVQVWSIAVEPLRCLSRSALIGATICADGRVSGVSSWWLIVGTLGDK